MLYGPTIPDKQQALISALRAQNDSQGPLFPPAYAQVSPGPQKAILGRHNQEEYVPSVQDMIAVSPAFCAQELLSGPSEPPYNGRFLVADHHLEWDELATAHDRICVLAPRDHGKSFFWGYAYVIWQARNWPNERGYIFSGSGPQASRILGDVKTEIETNPKLQWLMPKRTDRSYRWGETRIRLSNGHEIFARGYGSRIRGGHPRWILADDVLNDETLYSEQVRRKQNDYFFTAITNMIVPGGQIVVVGTPFHGDDLYAQLAKTENYVCRKYPAIDKGKALWPARYSVASLKSRQKEIGSVRFAREFLCSPISDDMSLFPLRLFVGDPVEQPAVKLGMPADYWDALGITRFMGVDFAMSSSVSADFTVIWVAGLDKSGNRWLVDIKVAKGLSYQRQLSLINAAARQYSPGLIFLESNQMQRIFGDELIRLTDLPIKKFTTGKQKHSLEDGVPSLRVLLENGKFRIPRGDRRSVELTDRWINEMRAFTWHNGKLQSTYGHDDMVMACWLADQAIREGSFEFSFGEDEDEDDEGADDYDPDDRLTESAFIDAFGVGDDQLDEDSNEGYCLTGKDESPAWSLGLGDDGFETSS